MEFTLHPNLTSKIFIFDLPLSRVLLEDSDIYPWLILVPRRANLSRLVDLALDDQLILLQELNQAQEILLNMFKPTQLNVAAIGNKTPQLHIHVIARNAGDPAWPGTVWDHPEKRRYTATKKQDLVSKLSSHFENGS